MSIKSNSNFKDNKAACLMSSFNSGEFNSGFSSSNVLNNQHPASECNDSSLIDHSTICPTPFNLFYNLNDNKIANDENKLTPSVNAENIANDCAISSIVPDFTCCNRSILLRASSSSINAAKSSKPNDSFSNEYASAWIDSNEPNVTAIDWISGFGNQCDTLDDQ